MLEAVSCNFYHRLSFDISVTDYKTISNLWLILFAIRKISCLCVSMNIFYTRNCLAFALLYPIYLNTVAEVVCSFRIKNVLPTTATLLITWVIEALKTIYGLVMIRLELLKQILHLTTTVKQMHDVDNLE